MNPQLSRRNVVLIILGAVVVVAAALGILFYAALEQVEPADLSEETNTEIEEVVAAGDPVLRFEEVATGFSGPVDIVQGNSQLYIVEQAGLIREMASGETVLDITDRVKTTANELGLLGMTFEPNFSNGGDIYINYTREGGNSEVGTETVISRLVMQDGRVDPASEEVVLSFEQPFNNHNAGDLVFGADGYLYIPTGDGGGGGDPLNTAQDTNSLLGKILRIDVVGQETYTVPATNPFVDSDGRDEIWTYGWRNPWRVSFDEVSGSLYVADVGQKAQEEISVVRTDQVGANYGWRCVEGMAEYDSSLCLATAEYVQPFATYDHTDADRCSGSVTGGYVYRGQRYNNLAGDYIFADFCTGIVYSQNVDEPDAPLQELAGTEFMISTFGQDSSGELYFADLPSGTIYQLVDASR